MSGKWSFVNESVFKFYVQFYLLHGKLSGSLFPVNADDLLYSYFPMNLLKA